VLAAVLLVWRVRHHTPKGFIVRMQAVDDGAVLVWRMNYEDGPARGWVSRVDAKGETRWWQPLPDVPLTGDGLQVGDGVVAVRYSHRIRHRSEDQALVAFSVDDGQPRWDRVLYPPVDGGEAMLKTYTNARFVGGALIEWVSRPYAPSKESTPDDRLISLDPRTGAQNWERQQKREGPPPQSVVTVGDRVLVHTLFEHASFAVGNGEPTGFGSRGSGCVVDRDYVTIQSDHDETRSLVAFGGGDPAARRVIASPFAPAGSAGAYLILRRCGTYGDRIVLVIDVEHHNDGTQSSRLVVITDRAGNILHTIELPADYDWDSQSIAKTDYEHASLAGTLTRFVPFISNAQGKTTVLRLYMLDLETGAIAWRGPEDEDLLRATVFRGTDHWYLISDFFSASPWVSVFDGATGKLVATKSAYSYNGLDDVLPAHIGGGKLWLASGEITPIDRPPIAILDANNLTPIAVHLVELADHTANQQERLKPE
jgi:outer membrane protein assembly factor BamB